MTLSATKIGGCVEWEYIACGAVLDRTVREGLFYEMTSWQRWRRVSGGRALGQSKGQRPWGKTGPALRKELEQSAEISQGEQGRVVGNERREVVGADGGGPCGPQRGLFVFAHRRKGWSVRLHLVVKVIVSCLLSHPVFLITSGHLFKKEVASALIAHDHSGFIYFCHNPPPLDYCKANSSLNVFLQVICSNHDPARSTVAFGSRAC